MLVSLLASIALAAAMTLPIASVNLQWSADRIFASGEFIVRTPSSTARLRALLAAKVFITNERAELAQSSSSSVTTLPLSATEVRVTWWKEFSWARPATSLTLNYELFGLTDSHSLVARDLLTGQSHRVTLKAPTAVYTLSRVRPQMANQAPPKLPKHARPPEPEHKSQDDPYLWLLGTIGLAAAAFAFVYRVRHRAP
ncbi:MAG: hypothetical protein CMH53_06810 [Myxococcales bacterium]|nr:hypothetical protein [Myxococcales bacterium]